MPIARETTAHYGDAKDESQDQSKGGEDEKEGGLRFLFGLIFSGISKFSLAFCSQTSGAGVVVVVVVPIKVA